MRRFFSFLAAVLIDVGEALADHREFLLALFAFTRFSRLFPRSLDALDGARRVRLRLGMAYLGVGLLVSPALAFRKNLALDLALIADEMTDEAALRWILRHSDRAAWRVGVDLSRHSDSLPGLVQFHLATLNPDAALAVARTAVSLGVSGAVEELADIESLMAEVSPWRRVIDDGRTALLHRLSGAPPAHTNTYLRLYVPAAAFRRNPRDYPGFRADIRRMFALIVSLLDEKNVAWEAVARLARYGDLSQQNRPFIAYHSVDTGPATHRLGLHVKETERQGFFSVDPAGYSGWAAFSDRLAPAAPSGAHAETVRVFVEAEREMLIGGNVSKYAQPTTNAPMPDTPFVFVALQVQDDSVQRLRHMHSFDMLEEVARTCRDRGVPVLVKRHPLCRSLAVSLVLRRGEKRGLFQVSTASVHTLIAGACAVCVINSSVGAEALLHGKPVYVFGRADYQGAAFQIRAAGDFARMFKPHRLPVSLPQMEAVVHALRHEYATNLRDETSARAFLSDRIDDLLIRAIRDDKTPGAK